MPGMSRTAAALSLLAAMTLTGANVAFGKAVVAAFPVYVFVLFRFVISSAALLGAASAEPGPKLKGMSFGQWRDLVLMSLLGMVGFTVLMFEGLKRTAAADAGIITATLPAVVALIGMALGECLSRLQAAAIALAVGGLGVSSCRQHQRRHLHADRQSSDRRRGAVRGELRPVGQAPDADVSAAAAGAGR
jgi:drug/metabolite transporter (DMT)-like permease